MIKLLAAAAIVLAQTQAPPTPPTPVPAPVPAPPPADAEQAADQPAPPAAENIGEVQVRAGYQAAEATRGPLDGRWRLALADGEPLYVFQISDSGGAPDARAASPETPQIEGAWRDLRRAGALDASGLFATVKHDFGRLSILFYEGAAPQARALDMDAAPGGGWTGELLTGDTRAKVVMTRD